MGFSLFGHYIPAVGLSNLHQYKYSSGGYTPLDRMMTPFWEWVALRVPVYVHPNVLTLLGLLGALCGAMLQLGHTPYLSEAAPSWVYVSAALLFFLQQTCDAVDGKHARRNGVSSPLGQLFDHGGDIMLTTPIALASMAFITAGTGLFPHIIAMASSQLFQFIYVWWELHFHVFYAATGAVGVTEAQWGIIIMGLISGFFGPWIWRYNILKLLPTSRVKDILSSIASTLGTEVNGTLLVQLLLVACNLWALVYNIVVGIRRARKRTLAASHVLCFLFYMFLQSTLWHFCKFFLKKNDVSRLFTLILNDDLLYVKSQTNKCSNACLNGPPETRLSPLLLYFTLTTSYSIFSLRLCLSATCRFAFRLFHWPLVPFFVASAAFIGFPWCQQHRHSIFLGVSAWNVLYLADFLHTSVSDVCNSLDISCFRVNVKKSSQQAGRQQVLQEEEEAEEKGKQREHQREPRPQRGSGHQSRRQRLVCADATVEGEHMQMQTQQEEEVVERVAARPRGTRPSKTKAMKGVDVNGENDVVSHYEAERRKGA